MGSGQAMTLRIRRSLQLEAGAESGEAQTEFGFVETSLRGQGLTGGSSKQGWVELSAVTREREQGADPGCAGQQVYKREQAEAEGQATGGAQADAAVHRADPAARVPVGQCKIGMTAVGPVEAEGAGCAAVIGDGCVPRGIPGKL